MLPDRTIERYQGDAGRAYHQSKRFIPDRARPWVIRARAAKIQPYVASGTTIFEYGVGQGWNLAGLVCARRLGYDVGAFLADEVRAFGIEFVSESSSLADRSVDVFLCHHTLEHVRNPPEVLTEARRLLVPGGRILLFVPFENEPRYRAFRPSEPNHHLYSWNAQTLGNLVAEMGFFIEEARVSRSNYDRFAAVWSDRFHLGELGYRWLGRLTSWLYPVLEVRVTARAPRD